MDGPNSVVFWISSSCPAVWTVPRRLSRCAEFTPELPIMLISEGTARLFQTLSCVNDILQICFGLVAWLITVGGETSSWVTELLICDTNKSGLDPTQFCPCLADSTAITKVMGPPSSCDGQQRSHMRLSWIEYWASASTRPGFCQRCSKVKSLCRARPKNTFGN